MNHCSWRVTWSVLAQSPPPPAPPPAVEPPPPPSSSLLHAAATSESASTPAAKNLSRFPLIWAPFPPGQMPRLKPPCDPTSCPIALPRADAAGRGHPLERRGGEEERQTQQARPQDVRPGLRIVRQRDVAHDPAAEPVLQS